MAFSIDKHLGIHQLALGLRAQRQVLLAGNLANADTPHYKARDVDFAATLERAGERTASLRRTHPRHLVRDTGGVAGAEVGYRLPMQPSLDGNTVETDVETAALADNALRYQATLMFLNGRIKSLKAAITGGE